MMEHVVSAHSAGPPLHTRDFDEAFHMLEGELIFQVEHDRFTTRAGEFASAPRNVPHALANHSDADACYLLVCTPAGLERHLARTAAASLGRRGAGLGAAAEPRASRLTGRSRPWPTASGSATRAPRSRCSSESSPSAPARTRRTSSTRRTRSGPSRCRAGSSPIILHRDAVSGGGYAMIATVISADMDTVGQSAPGSTTRFVDVSLAEALAARAERRERLEKLGDALG